MAASAVLAVGLGSCAPDNDTTDENHGDDRSGADVPQTIGAKFISLVERSIADGLVEGAQFSIVEDGEILHAQAFGVADREADVPMMVDTPINVASISKSFTAWGVLALTERNQIDLDEPIRNLLADRGLSNHLFADSDVTIEMLLSHTSGLSGQSVPVIPATRRIPDVADILLGESSVPATRIERTPGSEYSYSGSGYLVLQKMIEDQTQSTFAKYMADTILDPAAMSDSTFQLSPEILPRVAVYYRGDGRRRDPYHLPGAAGGLYSTAIDMSRFISLYTDKGRSIRNQIISEDRFLAMLTPIAAVTNTGSENMHVEYSLGHNTYLSPEGVRIVFHAGGNPGLRAIFIVAIDSNDGFFAVANNDRGGELLAELMKIWGSHYELTLPPYF